jgi:hypothetical protein
MLRTQDKVVLRTLGTSTNSKHHLKLSSSNLMKPELPHVVAASEHRYEGEKKA